MDIVECNEAFATHNLSDLKQLEEELGYSISQSKWNPDGSAIDIDYTNGDSGGRYDCIFSCGD